MIRRPPRSTRTDTLVPYTTLFRAVCVTSDSFGIRNQGQSSDESLAAAMEIVALAKQAGRSGQITIATAFGCPFEGEIAIGRVVEMAKRAADAEPREIALADTIGVGVPTQVAEMIGRVREAVEIGRAHV